MLLHPEVEVLLIKKYIKIKKIYFIIKLKEINDVSMLNVNKRKLCSNVPF